jgi:predicted Zn-dependent protease
MRARIPFFITGALLLGSCASTEVAPITSATIPREADEQQLWLQVQAQEQALLRSGFVVSLPEAERYLGGIVTRLYPQPLPEGYHLTVRVIADPSLNAFTMPNGALFVHTGLLARLENEAQVAAILAHEITHALHRHGLKSYRSMKNHAALANTLYIGAGGGLIGLLGAFGTLSSAMGYSRDLEREADATGFQMLVAAGYDPAAGSQVFRVLLEESARVKAKEPFFFGSHPRLAERSASFREFTAALPPARRDTGRTGAEEFVAILPAVLHANAEAALHAGDLDLHPGDARATYLLAESVRRRTKESERAEALSLYRAAVAADPALAEAQRGLGLELMKAGDRPGAAEAFRRYLELAPNAADRAHIQFFLKQCETSS